jgi:hypothetical protein
MENSTSRLLTIVSKSSCSGSPFALYVDDRNRGRGRKGKGKGKGKGTHCLGTGTLTGTELQGVHRWRRGGTCSMIHTR